MSCPDCFTGSVLDGEPKGAIVDIQGAYLAAGPGTPNRAIIFLTDIFGLSLKNSKILADNFAQHLQCDVWVPDIFAGHPPVTADQMKLLPDRAGVKTSFFTILSLIWAVLPSLPGLIRNRKSVVVPRTVSFVEKLQASKKYEKLGAIGYCFGGGVAMRMGATTDLFNSIILVHPSPPSDDDLKAIKVSLRCLTRTPDEMGIKPERMREIEAMYEGRKGKDTFVEYEIKTYKAHGFGARPNLAYPDVKEGYEKAFQQAVDWFNKTIPA
ncbi:hypothetical protein GGX14DRAFT_447636 [Mycena pura]|uniref:Dienelactone hydrolase domain-containing protein n=1 Tax=Mycena pura TaxID=153505 RepID=A0AAD6VK60_9AGAR|nr:hypothetical protein GGX14DRAFT_447636 [Mycena pura]